MKVIKGLGLGCLIMMSIGLEAREGLHIVGPSSLAPFSKLVMKQVNKNDGSKVVIKSSEQGFKEFCAGGGLNTPDIVNADRRITKEEFNTCVKNGVRDISEALIGYDATVLVHHISNRKFNISKEELMLAFLAKVPSKDGISLVDNPYEKWSDINANLPRKPIIIYTLKDDIGNLNTIKNMILVPLIEEMSAFHASQDPYKIRNDTAHLEFSSEKFLQALVTNKTAIGIMNYSLANEYRSKIETLEIEGVSPSIETISAAKYPLANKLYFYSKNKHKNQIHSMQTYLEHFMDKKMIGREGLLSKLGLIPLNKHKMYTKIKYMREGKKLLANDLDSDFFHLAL